MPAQTATSITTRCPAKLNLTFEILGLLPDNYHEVDTVLMAVSLEDEITFDFTCGEGLTHYRSYQSEVPGDFPLDRTNLISRAIEAYRDAIPSARQFDIGISIKKKIPIGSGMAGGSSNAACAFRALNAFFDQKLTEEQLLSIASTIGADVPFSLSGATSRGKHRGDKLEPVFHESQLAFVLAKPRHLTISTPWAYKEYDRISQLQTMDSDTTNGATRNCIKELENGASVEALAKHLRNDLEKVVFKDHPALSNLARSLVDCGAVEARLTGSGPTLYAVAPTLAAADTIKQRIEAIASETSLWQEITPVDFWVVESVNWGARVLGRQDGREEEN